MPTWTLTKEFRFEAAHQLWNHDGKCVRLHGHSFVGRVAVSGNKLVDFAGSPKFNMLLDFADLKKAIDPLVLRYLDHYFLNDTLSTDSPTSEFIARWLFNQLKLTFGNTLEYVEIEETCTSACRYTE